MLHAVIDWLLRPHLNSTTRETLEGIKSQKIEWLAPMGIISFWIVTDKIAAAFTRWKKRKGV